MRKILKWFLPRRKVKRITGESKKICNLQKDPEDSRDFLLGTTPKILKTLPPKVSLREWCGSVKDQGEIGSCASHAYASAFELMLRKDKPEWFIETSELFHYYNVRQKNYMNTYPRDSGQTLREGAKCFNQIGICPETLWPYDYRKFNEKPGIMAYAFARFWKITSYERCEDVDAIKLALVLGKPVILGIKVFDDFMRGGKCGLISLPSTNERYYGGHAVLVVGFDDEKKILDIQNSWGRYWGDWGYCYLPYDYLKNYLIDAWTINIE